MDFEVKRLIYADLDVHKKLTAVCITNPATLAVTYKTKIFSISNSDIATLYEWLFAHNVHDICIKSTSKYLIPIFNILESHIHVILTHSKYLKTIKGKKTDKNDLCLFRKGTP